MVFILHIAIGRFVCRVGIVQKVNDRISKNMSREIAEHLQATWSIKVKDNSAFADCVLRGFSLEDRKVIVKYIVDQILNHIRKSYFGPKFGIWEMQAGKFYVYNSTFIKRCKELLRLTLRGNKYRRQY